MNLCYIPRPPPQQGSTKRRGGASRCGACNSFESECTCQAPSRGGRSAAVAAAAAAFEEAALAAAKKASMSSLPPYLRGGGGGSPSGSPQSPKEIAVRGEGVRRERERAHPLERPRPARSSQEAKEREEARPDPPRKRAGGGVPGVPPCGDGGEGGVELKKAAVDDSCSSLQSGEGGQGMDVEDDGLPRREVSHGDTFGSGGAQGGAGGSAAATAAEEREGEQTPPPLSKRYDKDSAGGGDDDAEAIWTEHTQGSDERETPSHGPDAAANGTLRGDGDVDGSNSDPADGRGGGSGGGGSDGNRRDPGQEEEPRPPSSRDVWRPQKKELVEVARRMAPGMNKLGGTARVVKVDPATGLVDVRYVVEGGWERNIDPVYVRPATLDINQKRATFGRCIHCGSLRVDCQQECEYFTSRTPAQQGLYLTERSEEDRGLGGSSRRKERRRAERDHRRRRHSGLSRVSQEEGGDVEGREGGHADSQTRRRHLPQDWDEEGEPVPGSSEEEEDGGADREISGSGSDSDAAVGGFTAQRRRRIGRRLVDSSSGSDEGTADDAGVPNRRRLRDRSHGSDVGRQYDDDDSDIDLLYVRPGVRGHGGTLRARDRDRHSRRSRGRSSSEGTSETEHDSGQEQGEEEGEGEMSVSSESGRSGDGEEGGIKGTFLQAEGDEDELPPDIRDPTRGVKDPGVLKARLEVLLKQMETRDVTKLEEDVAAACR